MFEALHGAVTNAVHTVEDTVWENTRNQYFIVDEETGEYSPKMIKINLPRVENGAVTKETYEIPALALVKQNSVALKELSIEFDLELHDKIENSLLANLPKNVNATGEKTQTRAKLIMKFKSDAPPEGIMLINDALTKSIPR
jgi:hypothetical protein|tara:strand:- start:4865 stop:5290 length:426 start_codon:yes stop_codon:yes gene_type:complete